MVRASVRHTALRHHHQILTYYYLVIFGFSIIIYHSCMIFHTNTRRVFYSLYFECQCAASLLSIAAFRIVEKEPFPFAGES